MTSFKLLLVSTLIFFTYFIYKINITKFSDHDKVGADFKPYVDYVYFIADGNFRKKVERMDFYVGESRNGVLGECNLTWPYLQPEIDINKDYWYTLNEWSKLMLVAHEILHCSCRYFHHIDVTYYDKCPLHYSSSTALPPECIKNHLAEYVNQISQGCYGL